MEIRLKHSVVAFIFVIVTVLSLVTPVYAETTYGNAIITQNEVSSINVAPSHATLEQGKLLRLQATISPSSASNTKLTWSSNNSNVALVGSNGVVVGRNAGTAVITAKSANKKVGFCVVTVTGKTQNSIEVSNVSFSSSVKVVEEGSTAQLNAIVTPSNATNKNLTWKSNNVGIASVSSTGVVTGVKPGITIVVAESSNGHKASIIVRVKEKSLAQASSSSTQSQTNSSISTSAGNKPIYQHTLNGKLVKSYSNSSIDVKIESYSKYYIAKIWVKDPASQIKKVEAGWGKELKKTGTMLNATNKAIVGVNGSGFYKSGSWSPSSTWDKAILNTAWNYTTEGNYVIANGTVRRALSGQNARTTLGITKNGEMKYYENNPYGDLEKDGVYNSFAFGPLMIKDGQRYVQNNSAVRLRQNYKSEATRTTVGQVDKNNFIFIITKSSASLSDIASIGLKLNCKILFNLDGGGSTTLWFRNGISGAGTNVKGGSREVADALCFTTL